MDLVLLFSYFYKQEAKVIELKVTGFSFEDKYCTSRIWAALNFCNCLENSTFNCFLFLFQVGEFSHEILRWMLPPIRTIHQNVEGKSRLGKKEKVARLTQFKFKVSY